MLDVINKYFRKIQSERSLNKVEPREDQVTDHTDTVQVKDNTPSPSTFESVVSKGPEERRSLKTKSGIVIDTNDGVYTVKTLDSDEEIYVSVDSCFNFIVNDKVLITGELIEAHFGSDFKFEVKSIQPAILRKEFGRVTKIQKDFIVFEGKVLLSKSLAPSDLEIHQECQYEMIESDQKLDGESYKWRIVSVLKVINILTPKPLNLDEIQKNIKISAHKFNVPLNPTSTITKYILVTNDSPETVSLMRCSIRQSPPEIVKLPVGCNDGRALYHLKPQGHPGFKAYVQILPQFAGIFEAEFVAEFQNLKKENFTKISKFQIEVYNGSNVLSGLRVQNAPRFIETRFRDYLVPDSVREVDFYKTKEVIEILKKKFSFFDEAWITKENYVNKFSHAIYLDEIAMEIAFKAYHIPRTRFENKNNLLKLEVKDVAEKRPSIIVGDAVEVCDPFRDEKNQVTYKGFIHKVESDAVLIKFHDDFHEIHRGKEYTVNFCFSRTGYRQQQHAIETVIKNLGFEFLFPTKIPSRHLSIEVKLENENLKCLLDSKRKIQWHDSKLNKYQKTAIVNALRGECRPMPYIIYGPAGSGKTCTVVELIKQIFTLDQTTKLIVATPSNSAANIFATALESSGMFKKNDFIRLVSNNLVEKNLIPDHLMRYCATVSVSSSKRRDQPVPVSESFEIKKNLTKSDIENYRICIGTLACFGNLMQMKFLEDHFSHVIIDEAGQSTEPESLIPISLLTASKGQVILAGDPLQLGPISNSRYVKLLNLDLSLLERLLATNECYAQNSNKEYDPRFVTKLKINYRSLPSILKIYNDLFYEGELVGAVDDRVSCEADLFSSILDIQNLFPKPMTGSCSTFFVDVVKGKNRRVPDSCSWYCEEEINSIISFLSKMNSVGIEFKDIGIITPYALQVKKFKQKIAVALPDTDLKVGTVEEFQGEERHIILVSTVRTDEKHFNNDAKFGLGFLQCKKRMNVAISRAQSMLVVFGKGEVLRKDDNWKKFIEYTEQHSTFVVDDRT